MTSETIADQTNSGGGGQATASANTTAKSYFTGIVKQVLDGGAVVIRGQPRNGPPPERTLAIAEIEAPRLARRPGAPGTDASSNKGTPDEPYAWEAREFLRKLLVGKNVLCSVNYTTASNREYGQVLFGAKVGNKCAAPITNSASKLTRYAILMHTSHAWSQREKGDPLEANFPCLRDSLKKVF